MVYGVAARPKSCGRPVTGWYGERSGKGREAAGNVQRGVEIRCRRGKRCGRSFKARELSGFPLIWIDDGEGVGD